MTVLIGAALLLSVAFSGFRAVRSLGSAASTHNPVLQRLISPERVQQTDTVAETREADLTRQLLGGAIDAATYRQQLSELAEQSAARAGDPR